MSIKSIAHVCIKTADLARTREFYCDALGMEKVFDFIRNGEVIGCYLKAANQAFIEVWASEPEQVGNSRLHHFCLETDSIQGLRQRLVAQGYTAGEVVMGNDGTLQFWATDPNGLEIEFQQYTERSSQLTGRDVAVE